MSLFKINSSRLEQWLQDFAQFGKTAKGGVTRLAATNEDQQARDLFVQLAKLANCEVRFDAIGNIFARKIGKNPKLAPVLTGSHGDSQPQGGRFDGIYGVLAGLEVLYSLNDQQIQTERTIELVMWTNEEGSRFTPSMLGSSVFTGLLSLEDALNKTDVQEIKLGDELKRIGYAGNGDKCDYPIHAVIELHIEQGPILEQENKLVGVVTHAMGQKWYEITFGAMAGHAGTVPMNLRRDALLGLADAIITVNNIGYQHNPNARATVGRVQVIPNSSNVIAGQVTFSVEFRHPSAQMLENMNDSLRNQLNIIGNKHNLTLDIKPTVDFAPLTFDERLVNIVRQTANNLGYAQKDMVSGAGHDACHLSKIAPTAMIFIPCIDGISHNELENITQNWSEAGANTLLNTIIQLANEV